MNTLARCKKSKTGHWGLIRAYRRLPIHHPGLTVEQCPQTLLLFLLHLLLWHSVTTFLTKVSLFRSFCSLSQLIWRLYLSNLYPSIENVDITPENGALLEYSSHFLPLQFSVAHSTAFQVLFLSRFCVGFKVVSWASTSAAVVGNPTRVITSEDGMWSHVWSILIVLVTTARKIDL